MGTLEARFIKAIPGLLPSMRVLRILPHPRMGRAPAGLLLDVQTPVGRRRRLLVQARADAVPSRVREAIAQLKALSSRSTGYPMLASTFLSPRTRAICREEGVGYLDLAGNSFLQLEDCYLERSVERNPFPARGRPPSLFGPVSSRILRALLEEPSRSWLLSELARVAHVSLGHASNVTRRLIGEEWLDRRDGRLHLAQPARLLDEWRQRLSAAGGSFFAYYSFERDPQRLMRRVAEVARERQWRYAVTSFAAASLVAPFVHGVGTVQWYVADAAAVDAWVGALDLRPVEEGPSVILRVPEDAGVFYRVREVGEVTLVGDIQLYLDLYREPGRGQEQAEFLRKERLGW